MSSDTQEITRKITKEARRIKITRKGKEGYVISILLFQRDKRKQSIWEKKGGLVLITHTTRNESHRRTTKESWEHSIKRRPDDSVQITHITERGRTTEENFPQQKSTRDSRQSTPPTQFSHARPQGTAL